MTLLSILGIGGRAARPTQTVLSGVRSSLTAQHRSEWGDVHEHTWEVTVWVRRNERNHPNAVRLREELDKVLSSFSGKCLPDRFAWAENLAPEIARLMACDYDTFDVVAVEIARNKEGLLAVWRLDQ